jgi:serine/threonine protein phosphatase PrpC
MTLSKRPEYWLQAAEWSLLEVSHSNIGFIFCCLDQFGRPLGPARVWKKDEYSPGLAMARAFADVEGRSCGLTSEPDVTEHNIVPEDRAIVLGSDGIYDFLSNEEIANTIMKFYPELDAKKAADSLVTRAAAKWKQVLLYFVIVSLKSIQNSIICDDLTCIVVFI